MKETNYSIGFVAQKMGLSTHTLRYYDKEGLLPFVQKAHSGKRVFTDVDMEWLVIIECLKGTGMSIKGIKQYIDWCLEGDSTLALRLQMFEKQKNEVESQLKQLKEFMKKLKFKISYYQEAMQHGSINVYERNKCLAEEKKRIFGGE